MNKSDARVVDEEREAKVSIFEKIRRFYRGTFFQAILLGLVSFTQPGIWVGLNNLGAGGMASPFFVNAANVITFVIMVFFSPISAIVGNRFNLKWVLVFGTLGYAPYSAALYCNSVFGTHWFLLFGAATCGFSAAALWSSEAAIAVGYPEASKRGLYISIWLALNKLGQIIGSSIQLPLNIDNDQQALMISPPEKLICSDGTKPTYRSHQTPVKQGFRDFWTVCKEPRIYMMIPIFISAQWGQTYQGNYLTAYFSVRGRALGRFIISILGSLVDILFGYILDSKFIRSRATRGRVTWVMIVVAYTATWAWNFLLEVGMSRTKPALDYTSPGYGRAVGVYCLYRVGYESVNVWMYWVLGTFDSEVATLALTTALLRGGESLGSSFSYGAGASKSASLLTNLIVAAVVFWASVPPTTWSIWSIRDDEKDKIPPSSGSEEGVEFVPERGLKD